MPFVYDLQMWQAEVWNFISHDLTAGLRLPFERWLLDAEPHLRLYMKAYTENRGELCG